jgi:outer membrane protein OmpA-like peptidoglycan-associated protein
METRLGRWLMVALLGMWLVPPVARAGQPVVGIETGAAIPTGDSKKTVDIGGAIAGYVGYQFGDQFTLTLLGQPQFVAFPTAVEKNEENDITSLFSFTAGPRFSMVDENKEVFFSVQGGVYTDTTGPLNDTSSGFSIAGGLNYDLQPGTALGIFLRRDQAQIPAARGSSQDFTFLVTGLSLRHRFLPPPPVVAQVPPPPPPPAPAPPPVKKKIVLRGVHFDFDKSAVRADARPILDEAVSTLKEEPGIMISVEGHTDGIGSDAYNQKLSVRRAEAVRDYLASHGIEGSRMTVRGFGKSQPVATNATADGRAQNRRVELRVTSQP